MHDLLYRCARVAEIGQINFRPGAVADHLTSPACFDGSTQMSALDWLRQGATGSYGSVSEPCAIRANFPIQPCFWTTTCAAIRYSRLLEECGHAGPGLFIGEPLARPYQFVIDDGRPALEGRRTIDETSVHEGIGVAASPSSAPASASALTASRDCLIQTTVELLRVQPMRFAFSSTHRRSKNSVRQTADRAFPRISLEIRRRLRPPLLWRRPDAGN